MCHQTRKSGRSQFWIEKGLADTRFPIWQLEGQGMKEGVEPGTHPHPCHYGAEGRFQSWLSGSMVSSKVVECIDMGSRADWQWWPWTVTKETTLDRGLGVRYIPDPTMTCGLGLLVSEWDQGLIPNNMDRRGKSGGIRRSPGDHLWESGDHNSLHKWYKDLRSHYDGVETGVMVSQFSQPRMDLQGYLL